MGVFRYAAGSSRLAGIEFVGDIGGKSGDMVHLDLDYQGVAFFWSEVMSERTNAEQRERSAQLVEKMISHEGCMCQNCNMFFRLADLIRKDTDPDKLKIKHQTLPSVMTDPMTAMAAAAQQAIGNRPLPSPAPTQPGPVAGSGNRENPEPNRGSPPV